MKEKKGEMTIGTLIAIILGLVVLVLLIVGFTGGWNNFTDKLNVFGSAGNNIADYELYCQQACLRISETDFCEFNLPLEYGEYNSSEYTCDEIAKETMGNEKISLGFTKDETKDPKNITMNVASCPTITC